MNPDVFYVLLAVMVLLAPLALQTEVRYRFGWAPSYPRALLITSLLFAGLALPFALPIALGWFEVLEDPETSPMWLVLTVPICGLGVAYVLAFCTIALLLRSPSGYPLRADQYVRLTRDIGLVLLGLLFGLMIGGPFVFGQLAATSGAELSATYARPLPLFVAYLATVGMIFWCIERFAYHQLRGEVTGYGTALVLFGAPIVVIAALPLLKPLLPTTLEAVRPLHVVVGMLTINLLFSSIVWPLLSFDARRLLPPVRILLLGAYLSVGLMIILMLLDIALAVFTGIGVTQASIGTVHEP